MSQSVSSAFITATTAAARTISRGLLISWTKAINPSYNFFTIGTSIIGGPDQIMGGGGAITQWDKYQYSDYTKYATSISIQRALGQYPYGVVGAQLDIEIDNTSKLFLPGQDPTIGNYILPGRPIKVSFGLNGELVNEFVGITDQPANTLVTRTTKLHAFDMMDYLNSLTSYTTGLQTNQRLDQILAALATEAGLSSTQYVFDQSVMPVVPYFAPYGYTMGQIFQWIAEAEQGLIFVDETGILRFWNRQHLASMSTTSFAYTYSSMLDVQMVATPIINYVTVQANMRALQANAQIYSSTTPFQIPAGSGTGGGTITNLIKNPNFETDTTKWTATYINGVGPTTISRNTTQHYAGAASLEADGFAQSTPGGTNYYYPQPYYTFLSGEGITDNSYYTAQMRIKGTAGQTVQMYVSLVTNFNSTSVGSVNSNVYTLSGGWDLISFTFQAPPTTLIPSAWLSYGYSWQFGVQGVTSYPTIYIDNVMVEAGQTLHTYFDGGNNPGGGAVAWTGTANESTSTYTPTAPPAGQITITLPITDANGGLPLTAVDSPVYSATPATFGDSAYSVSLNQAGGGLDVHTNVTVSGVSIIGGSAVQMTFSNTNTEPVWVTALYLWGIAAKVTSTSVQSYQDSTSQSLYGVNPSSSGGSAPGQPVAINNPLIQSIGHASSNAYNIVQDHKSPNKRFTAPVFSAPQLQIGDGGTVAIADTGITYNMWVTGNTLKNIVGDLQQTLEFQERVIQKYFTINVSTIGGTDGIAP